MGVRFPGMSTFITYCDDTSYGLQGNYERILASIVIAKSRGARLRVGPELEVPYVLSPCPHRRNADSI